MVMGSCLMYRCLPLVILLGTFAPVPGDSPDVIVIAVWDSAQIWSIALAPPGQPSPVYLHRIIPSTARILSFDTDFQNKTLFLSEQSFGGIYTLTDYNNRLTQNWTFTSAHDGISAAYAQVAIDSASSISKNLLWTDGHFDWVAIKPAYSTDSTEYKVLMQTDLRRPEALTIDSENGLLFLSETSNNTRIERATMAGKDRKVIVSTRLSRVFSMTVDPKNKTLYWVDSGRSTIEFSDYDGKGRTLLYKESTEAFNSVDYHQGSIFAVSANSEKVYIVDVITGVETVVDMYAISGGVLAGSPHAIHYSSGETANLDYHPCDNKSCEQMCVKTPSGAECLCKEGYTLKNDSLSCEALTGFFGKGLLFSNMTSICMLEIQTITGFYNYPIPCVSMENVSITTIAADMAKYQVYYIDVLNNYLMQYSFITMQNVMVTIIENAESLFFDWIDRYLMWIDNSTNQIKAFALVTELHFTIYTSNYSISHLTADPHSRTLFWLSKHSGSTTIMASDYGGTAKIIIADSGATIDATLLYYDVTYQRLYWINGIQLYSSKSDGTDIQSHVLLIESTDKPDNLVIYKDFAVWERNQTLFAGRVSADITESGNLDLLSGYGEISSLIVYDSNAQKSEQDPCTIFNGGCEQICIPENGEAICRCDFGQELQSDKKSCKASGEVQTTEFLVVSDVIYGDVLQISETGDKLTVLDIQTKNPSAMVFDKTKKEVLWSSGDPEIEGTIYVSSLYGVEGDSLPVAYATIVSMAIDYSTGNIFFIANSNITHFGFIGVIHHQKNKYKMLIYPYDEPGDIQLYPSKGLLIASEYGWFGALISKINMDGTSYQDLVLDERVDRLIKPMGLAIDYSSDRIYWTDNELHTISSCDLSGNNRQQLLMDNNGLPSHLAFDDNFLYYTAWNRHKIMKVNKDDGSSVSFMDDVVEIGRLENLAIYPGSQQPVNEICAHRNGNCSTFCLPVPNGRVCECADGDYLKDDRRTCSDVIMCPSSFQNGKVEQECFGYPYETCDYTCKAGYVKSGNISSIVCDEFGSWDQNVDTLCQVSTLQCPPSIPNGNLTTSCGRKVNEECTFQCNFGHASSDGSSVITCQESGSWNKDVNSLCEMIVITCSDNVKNGNITTQCQRNVNDSCAFSCNSGYTPVGGRTSLTCGKDGHWDADVNTVCERDSPDVIVIAVWDSAQIWSIALAPPGQPSPVYLHRIIPSTARILSFDTDFQNKTLFLSEQSFGGIYTLTDYNNRLTQNWTFTSAHDGISAAYAQVAIDSASSISKNLLWTDGHFDWVAIKPAYSTDSTEYKVLMQTDLRRPEALTIDSENGLLFLSETSNNTRIERATMAGKDRKVIVSTRLSRVFSMTVDPKNKTLYWVDSGRSTIEYSDYDGKGRTLLYKESTEAFNSVDYHQGSIFAVSANSEKVYIVDVITGVETVVDMYAISGGVLAGSPHAIHYSSGETANLDYHPCDNKSCEQMCVKTPSGAECLCKEGYTLKNDSLSCEALTGFFGKGLLFSNMTSICMLEIQTITGFYNYPIPCVSMENVSITTIAADMAKYQVYYVDVLNNYLMQYSFITMQNVMVTIIENAESLFFDWIDRYLMWIDNSTNQIKAFALVTELHFTIYTSNYSISHLTADPHSRTLFWLSKHSGSTTIMASDYGGTAKIIIADNGATIDATLLYYDVTYQRLYWINGIQLYSSKSDGTDIQSHVLLIESTDKPDNLVIYKDFAVWERNQTLFAGRVSADITESGNLDLLSGYGEISSLIVYDSNAQKSEQDPCTIFNGGCEQICIPENGEAICRCDFGQELQSDKKSCKASGEVQTTEFLIVSDVIYGDVLQISETGDKLTVLDIQTKNPSAMVFDKTKKEVLWSSGDPEIEGTIYVSSLYGVEGDSLPVAYATIVSMAIDYSTGNIFFIANSNITHFGFIGVIHHQKNKYKMLIYPYDEPGDIQLYPSKGLLIASEYGLFGALISKINMDGTSYQDIVLDERVDRLIKPMGLAIDYSSDRIYWTDNELHTISSCDLSGNNRQQLLMDNNGLPSHLAFDDNFLYYTAWNRHKIMKVNKDDGSSVSFMDDVVEIGRLENLAIYPGSQQPVNEICAHRNGNCSTFCLPVPNGRVCECADGDYLKDDRRTCSDVIMCPSSFQNGKVEQECFGYPYETCDYTCKAGYVKSGNISSIVCDEFGSWDQNVDTLCQVSTLQCPPSIPNGNLTTSCGRKVNEECTFQCNFGHASSDGSSVITCQESGSWNKDVNSLCEMIVITCSDNVKNGNITTQCQRNVNDSCAFSCNSGYTPVGGRTSLTCGKDGHWDADVNTVCEPKLCPASVLNGNLTSCSRLPMETCRWTCARGYLLSLSVSEITCGVNGQWNYNTSALCYPILCSGTIDGGLLSQGCSRHPGTTCGFTCNSGYTGLAGVSSLTCGYEGKWNHETNTLCTLNLCPSSVTHGSLSSCNRRPGESCVVSCDRGYTSSGTSAVLCGVNGQWNQDLTTVCTPILCPTSVNNGQLTSCTGQPDTTCPLTCNSGYVAFPIGLTSLKCGFEGAWNYDNNAVCKPLCPSPSNHTMINCMRYPNSTCTFSCISGYESRENVTTLQCGLTGFWDRDINNLCQQITCPTAIPGTQASLVNCGMTANAECDYNCPNGYQKNPTLNKVICLPSKKWDISGQLLCSQIKVPLASTAEETGVIAGGSIAAVIVVVIIAILVIFILMRRRQRKAADERRILSDDRRSNVSVGNPSYQEGVYDEIGINTTLRDETSIGYQNPGYAFPPQNKAMESSNGWKRFENESETAFGGYDNSQFSKEPLEGVMGIQQPQDKLHRLSNPARGSVANDYSTVIEAPKTDGVPWGKVDPEVDNTLNEFKSTIGDVPDNGYDYADVNKISLSIRDEEASAPEATDA